MQIPYERYFYTVCEYSGFAFCGVPAFLHFNLELAPLLKYQDPDAYNLLYAGKKNWYALAFLPIPIVHVVNHAIHVKIQISECNCRWP